MLGANILNNAVGQQRIPRVKSTAEADKYPSMPNSETVLIDEKEEDIIYIKATDQNGMGRTVRYRCIEEPEPTLEDTLNNNFVSKDDFNNFVNEFRSFRKEMMANAQHSTVNAGQRQSGSGKQ